MWTNYPRLDIWLTSLKASLELSTPYRYDEKLLEYLVKFSFMKDCIISQASDFTLCLNCGVDIYSRLWKCFKECYDGTQVDISDDLMLALIEMGALDDCHVQRILMCFYFQRCMYGMLEKLASACPSAFRNLLHCPMGQ